MGFLDLFRSTKSKRRVVKINGTLTDGRAFNAKIDIAYPDNVAINELKKFVMIELRKQQFPPIKTLNVNV